MKKLFIFLILYAFYSIHYTHSAHALYSPASVPNNKLGVHILNPSELDTAANFVNSSGGDWGYVTVPIQPTDRDLPRWQEFMQKCKDKHLIPIIRITTIPQGGTWESGKDTDLVDFANFLNDLSWPVENRYIILFNEVNRSAEWGGVVEPAKYTEIVKNARAIFKERSEHFFLLGPALDDALPDSSTSMSAKKYMTEMYKHDAAVWSYFDGFAFHSYPNPGFSQPPKDSGFPSIVSYRYLFSQYKLVDKPVFITETGWDQTKVKPDLLPEYWNKAWDIWSRDARIIAVTPFLLDGGTGFPQFTLKNSDGTYTPSGAALVNIPKLPGNPKPGIASVKVLPNTTHQSAQQGKSWKRSSSLLTLENIFRVIIGLPTKAYITINDKRLLVEQAQTPTQWEKGLSDRDQLDGVDGMIFLFTHYHIPIFWMKDTRLPLDMLWIAGDTIVEITPNVPVPTSDTLPTYSPQSAVDTVLELPAGYSESNNIKVGDRISL